MTGFTKGPREATQDRGLTLFVCEEDDHLKPICEILTGNGKDAKLLAASLDMYEALKAAYATIVHLDEHLHGIVDNADGLKIQEAYAAIKAALARADGKS